MRDTVEEAQTLSGGSPAEVLKRFLPLLGKETEIEWLTAWGQRRGTWVPLSFWGPKTELGMVLPENAVVPDDDELRRRVIEKGEPAFDAKKGNFAFPIAGVVIVGRVRHGAAPPKYWRNHEGLLLAGLEQGLWRERWRRIATWSAGVLRARSEDEWMNAWREATMLLDGVDAQALDTFSGDMIYPDPHKSPQMKPNPMRLPIGPGYTWVIGIDGQHWAWDMAQAMANQLQSAAYAVTEWKNMRDAATIDDLTKILNRRGFQTFLEQDLIAGVRGVFMIFDLNHFKEVNDQHGHGEGDRALREIAQAWRRSIRPTDRIGRFGGDEFVAWAPNLQITETVQWVERQVRNLPLKEFTVALPPDTTTNLTISAGCCASIPGDTFETLYGLADVALYAAKEEAHQTLTSVVRTQLR